MSLSGTDVFKWYRYLVRAVLASVVLASQLPFPANTETLNWLFRHYAGQAYLFRYTVAMAREFSWAAC